MRVASPSHDVVGRPRHTRPSERLHGDPHPTTARPHRDARPAITRWTARRGARMTLTLPGMPTDRPGMIGSRQLIVLQTLDIARLTAHPVRLIPETFVAVTR